MIDDVLNSEISNHELAEYYSIIFDEKQGHKFTDISHHLQTIKQFKEA